MSVDVVGIIDSGRLRNLPKVIGPSTAEPGFNPSQSDSNAEALNQLLYAAGLVTCKTVARGT